MTRSRVRVSFPVALVNAPWGHRGEGLLPQPARTRAVIPAANQRRASTLVWVEFSDRAEQIVRRDVQSTGRHPGWGPRLVVPPWNHTGPHKDVVTGLLAHWRRPMVDQGWLIVPIPNRDRPLHFPVAVQVEPTTRQPLVTIGGHNLTARDAAKGLGGQKTRTYVSESLADYGEQVHEELGWPVVNAMDTNESRQAACWADWSYGVRHGVDVIRGLGVSWDAPYVDHSAVGTISDRHPLLRVTARVEVTETYAPGLLAFRLPQPTSGLRLGRRR